MNRLNFILLCLFFQPLYGSKASQTIITPIRESAKNFSKKHVLIMEKFYAQFRHVPGALKLLELIYSSYGQPRCKGYLYEAEKALALQEPYGQKKEQTIISGFSQKVGSPELKKAREFDIITEHNDHISLYECKNINWNYADIKTVAQFDEQKDIADNLQNSYMLCSNQPIPDGWKSWLEYRGITFEEESNA